MTANHSEHLTLISSSVFNVEDAGETLEALEKIYSSKNSGKRCRYDKGEVGFYVSSVGRENIAEIIKRESEDGNFGELFLMLQDIPTCEEGEKSDFSNCDDMSCLCLDEIDEYSSCKESLVYISSTRDAAHICDKVAIYPVQQYEEKYSHRRIIQQKLDGLNIENSLLNGAGKAFMNVVFADRFFNDDVFKVRGNRHEICKKVFSHICVIDDYASKTWAEAKCSTDIMNTFNSYKVTVSPESSNRHKDKKYMRRRNILFRIGESDVVFQCEWHSKITGNGGRIYFYVPSPGDVSKYPEIREKVLIGKVCHHL
ncbi:hypothetical protein [Rothia mucilaginosa]|jgi:hypothetical protein|uniref:hypothetical protein n=1 Tax=Rothia mucilaginosa TaxID=43675 RepID=UPI0039A1B33B